MKIVVVIIPGPPAVIFLWAFEATLEHLDLLYRHR